MIYLEVPASPPLRPFVRTLWYCHAPGAVAGRERVLPDGRMQVVLNLCRDFLTDCPTDGGSSRKMAPAILIGVRSGYEVIETSDMEELAVFSIEPGGFSGLFKERADLCFGRSFALHDLWRDAQLIDRLREAPTPAEKMRRLDVSLLCLLRGGSQRSVTVDHALSLFRNKGAGVRECARSLGVSERYLSRVFREEVGVAPKLWCRMRRFQAVARSIHAGTEMPWAELALRCGYYDQAHFANDFKAFSGLDATTYSAGVGRWHNHVSLV